MLFVTTPVHSRRVLVLGAAGLVPAALVTLLLVHQPAVGDRRVYPMLRGSLTLVGLGLALATLITWATVPDRLSRWSLTGLAWAGVSTILCIGPFLESTPRARLYALDVATGDVVWATSRAWTAPVLVDGYLVVTDIDDRSLVGLDPATGREQWRHRIAEADAPPRVVRAVAAGAYIPDPDLATPLPSSGSAAGSGGISAIAGGLQRAGRDGRQWSMSLPGDQVLGVAGADAGDTAYAYVSTPGAAGRSGGAIIKLDADDGDVHWRSALPDTVAVAGERAALAASGDAVVVAGGERIGVLNAEDGQLRWTQSVVTLGKSRGFALPGAVQQVIITDTLVFLSTTPES